MDENHKKISDRKILAPENWSPRPVMCNYMSLPAGHRREWKCRSIPEYELILLLRGEFVFVNHDTGETRTQRPGELLCIYPGEFHSYYYSGPPEREAFFSCIHFEYDAKMRRLPGEYRPEREPPRLMPLREKERISGYFRELARMFRRPSRLGEEKKSSLLRLLLLELEEMRLAGENPGEGGAVKKMTDYLDENILRHPSRRELAENFRLSCAYVNFLFRKHLDLSPTEYVHRRLAFRALELMSQQGMSVKETAAALNFANAFYFCRVFKKVFGFPPSGRRMPGGGRRSGDGGK